LVASTSSAIYKIKVQCSSPNYCAGATYGIKIVNISGLPVTVGGGYVENTLTKLTPFYSSYNMTHGFSVNSGTHYSVQWDDSIDGTGAYSQGVAVSLYYVTSPYVLWQLIFSDSNGGYNNPDGFTAGKDSTVIAFITRITGTTAPGYAIRIY
jgi:hypothetical protein